MGGEADAVELVDVVEDGQVLAYGCDPAGSCLRLRHQPLPHAAPVLRRVGAAVAHPGQPHVVVALSVGLAAVEEHAHLLPAVLALAAQVVHLAALSALLVGVVAEALAQVAPVGLQVFIHALQAVLVVLCVLPLF